MIIPYGQWYDIIMKRLEYFFDGHSIINQGIIVKIENCQKWVHAHTAKVVKLMAAEKRDSK